MENNNIKNKTVRDDDNKKRMMMFDIINWVKMKVVMIKESDKGRGESSPPIIPIKTRVSNNSPYITTTATLVPH